MALVASFLRALGYDIFNPAEVMPEFSADLPLIKAGERVDYAILEKRPAQNPGGSQGISNQPG